MSVLIKGMEMPKCCLECPFEYSPEFDSYCIAIGNEFIGEWEGLGTYKPDWCPLQDAPTVGEWIPVSERLPNTNGIYIVTRRRSDGFECRNLTDACYFDGSSTWHDDTRVNHERKYLADVLAWMPLPEPYEGGDLM